MWKKTCWKERFQLGVAYWPLQGGHAKTFLTTVCCFGFSCSRLYENRQQTAAMQDWDILYTQTAHILYRGSKCCTHWPQIGRAGDTGHTPDTAIPQKLPHLYHCIKISIHCVGRIKKLHCTSMQIQQSNATAAPHNMFLSLSAFHWADQAFSLLYIWLNSGWTQKLQAKGDQFYISCVLPSLEHCNKSVAEIVHSPEFESGSWRHEPRRSS